MRTLTIFAALLLASTAFADAPPKAPATGCACAACQCGKQPAAKAAQTPVQVYVVPTSLADRIRQNQIDRLQAIQDRRLIAVPLYRPVYRVVAPLGAGCACN